MPSSFTKSVAPVRATSEAVEPPRRMQLVLPVGRCNWSCGDCMSSGTCAACGRHTLLTACLFGMPRTCRHPDETGARAEPPLGQPLLASPSEVGIKRVGLIYSPGRSWWLGVSLMGLAGGIFVLTIATAIWHP